MGFGPDDPDEVTVRISLPRTGPVRRQVIATLRVVAGRDMLKHITLAPGEEIVMGRDERTDLQLNDITVSKRHVRVSCDHDQAITVHDLDSTNGTAVNGSPIKRSMLRPGDHLEVGAVSLRLDLLSLDELGHLGRVLQRLEAANRCPLTGLLTRAYLNDELSQLVDRCARAGVPFSCSFVDLDHFKSINDRFGHQVGDEVLVGVARLIMLGVRDADPCVRYGGEELVVFLPGSPEANAAEVAERIRRSIANHDWVRTAPNLQVTASFGVAERTKDEPIADWLNRSDKSVYAAKHGGRNRVIRASQL
jgi:diguanylate cyclase (GGDEF)-like protein